MKGKWISLILIYFLSVIIRIYPMFVTPIPYNVDALTDSRASQYIASHGSLNFPSGVSYNNHHTPITPLFNALSGALSQLVGMDVIHILPLIFPFLTSLSVLGWYLFSKKLTNREDVALITSALFAISGTYVLQTALVWKEAIGFVLMPIALYTYRKKSAISIFILIILPLTHHYVALITYISLTFSESINLYKKFKDHRIIDTLDKTWIFSLITLWIYMSLYYYIRHFNRVSQLSSSSDSLLFISIYVLLLILGIKLMASKYKKIRLYHIAIISIIPIVFYITYFFNPIFSHTMKFNYSTFIFTIGYIILLPIISIGMYIMLTTKYKERPLFISLLLAPLQMILFFILHGFDPVSYGLTSRTYDFLDPTTHTSLAVGCIKSKKKIISFTIVFLIVATTTPLAYHTSEAFGVNYFIYPDELHGAQWIKDHFKNITISSDNKLSLVARNEYDINSSGNLPYLLKNNASPENKVWLVGSYWSKGAQMSPMAPIKVNVTKILQQNSVLFSSGKTYVVLNNTS